MRSFRYRLDKLGLSTSRISRPPLIPRPVKFRKADGEADLTCTSRGDRPSCRCAGRRARSWGSIKTRVCAANVTSSHLGPRSQESHAHEVHNLCGLFAAAGLPCEPIRAELHLLPDASVN